MTNQDCTCEATCRCPKAPAAPVANHDELERAAHIVDGVRARCERESQNVTHLDALRHLRAEEAKSLRLILSANREMREALEAIATAEVNEFRINPAGRENNIQIDGEEWFCLSRDVRPALEIARSALTTQRGE